RERIALLVVREVLEERLPDAGRDAAVHLPLGNQRVHDGARVVDRDEVAELDLACLRVDLDYGDVRAEREGGSARLEDLGGAQLREPSLRGRGRGELLPR